MNPTLKLVVCLMAWTISLLASETHIADVIYNPANGRVATGQVTITPSQPLRMSNGAYVTQQPATLSFKNGVFAVDLPPNDTTPGSYYKVLYQLADGTSYNETWFVPTSVNALKIGNIVVAQAGPVVGFLQEDASGHVSAGTLYNQQIQVNGVSLTKRPKLNLVQGPNTLLSTSDSVDTTTVTIQSLGGGGSGGGGGINAITLQVPSWLAVQGSPLTTNGTLAITPAANLSANLFLATPAGAVGPVGPRTIVAGDLPTTISSNTTGTAADVTGVVGIIHGGTGSTTPASALAALGGVNSTQAAAAAPVQSVNGQTGAVTFTIPSTTGALTNDAGFVTAPQAAAAAPVQSVNGQTGVVTVPLYSLPVATATVLGGVKQGSNTAIAADGKITVPAGSFDAAGAAAAITLSGLGGVTSAQAAAAAPVQSFNTRTGAITPVVGDYSAFYDAIGAASAAQTAAQTYASNASNLTSGTVAGARISPINLASTLNGGVTGLLPYASLSGAPVIPATTSQLTNNSGFITAAGAPVQSVNGNTGAVTIPPYSLPVATTTVLGGVKQGSNTAIAADGAITVPAGSFDPSGAAAAITLSGLGGVTSAQAKAAAPIQTINGGTGVSGAVTTEVPLTFGGGLTRSANSVALTNPLYNQTVQANGVAATQRPIVNFAGSGGTSVATTDNGTNTTTVTISSANAGSGVTAFSPVAHQFLNQVNSSGVFQSAQPAAADVTGLSASATTDTTNAGNISAGTMLAARMPAFTGDVTTTAGSVATTVKGLNGTSLAGLATGLLKNTTTTGAPSIAVAGTDYQAPLGFTAENAANKGSASGYAPLNASSLVPLLNLPTIPASQTSGFATVATSGSYPDLINKPAIPTAVSQLTNDSGYVTDSGATIVHKNAATSYTAGNKQTFQSSATTAGLGNNSVTADPSTPAAGDLWFRSDLKHLRLYDGTALQSLMTQADLLGAAQFPALTGDVTTTAGSLTATLPNIVTAGTNPKITYNAKGQVTAGTALASGDIPNNAANTTGTAANVTGTVAIANGGTGAITAPAALTALGAQPALGFTAENSANKGIASGYAPLNASSVVPLVNLPTIPATQTSGFTTVATSGSYADLSNKPTFNSLSPVTTLGDLIVGSGANTSSRLAGNTTSTKNLLCQTGTGTVSALPSWCLLAAGDIPSVNLAGTGNGGVTGLLPYTSLSGTPTIPTNTNQLTNGANFITAAGAPVQSVNGNTGAVTIPLYDQTVQVAGTAQPQRSKLNFVGSGATITPTDNGTDTTTLTITPTSSMVYPGAGVAVSTGTTWAASLAAPASPLVGISDTQTLTNKSIASTEITGLPVFPSGTIVGTTDTQTLTNKSIAGSEINSGSVGITNGGTGQTTAAGAFNALSPMTTLGDTEYESAAGTASRLAGNTTATKKLLCQTGTGTVSAAPSWCTLASGDIPANAANTTGTASNITGVAAIVNGGTGATTASSALANLGGTTLAAATAAAPVQTVNGATGNITTEVPLTFTGGLTRSGNSVSLTTAYPLLYNQTVEVAGTPVTQRSKLNFVGSGATITPTDNGTDTTTLTIAVTGTGSGISGTTTSKQTMAGPLQSDFIRSSASWADSRSFNAVCDSLTDTTTTLNNSLQLPNGHIELPGGVCEVAPGTGTTAALSTVQNNSYISGVTTGLGSRFQANNSNTGPVLGIGDGSTDLHYMTLRDFSISGTTGVNYPNGLLSLNRINLSKVDNLQINNPNATGGSIGMNSVQTGTTLFQEMKFYDLSAFCNSCAGNNIGFNISSPSSNVDFISSNVEGYQTGVKFQGSDGSPRLYWSGGHFERIPYTGSGGYAFWIDQAEPFIVGADVEAGMIWLGSSVAGGDISLGTSSAGWNSFYVDNGIGNKFRRAASGTKGTLGLEMDGGEWFRTANNVVTDPTFMANGTTGWTPTNATVATSEIKSPGTKAGRSLQVTSTTAGGYISQSFAVSPSTDYLLSGVFYFNKTSTSAQIQVYDQASTLVWDSGSFGAAVATPTGTDSSAFRKVTQWIPSGTATSFTVRIIAPATTSPVILSALLLNQSAATMSGRTITGAGACSGTGTAYTCTTPGRNNGAANNNIQWTTTAQPYGAFLFFHVTTASDSVSPEIIINGTGVSTTTGNIITLVPGSSQDYTIPLGSFPNTVQFLDYAGPTTDSSDMTISQVAIVPIWNQTVIPITSYADGQYLQGITPDGIQHRSTVSGGTNPGTQLYYTTPASSFTGTGAAQTLASTTIGPIAAGQGIEVFVQALRTAGTGVQTYTLKLDTATAYTCTYTNSTTSGPAFMKVRIKNIAGSQSTQIVDNDPVYSNGSFDCGSVGGGQTALVNWSTSHTLSANWTGATSADIITFEQMAVYSK